MKKISALIVSTLLITSIHAQKRKTNSSSSFIVEDKKENTNFSCPDFRNLKWGSFKESLMMNGSLINFQRANVKNDTTAYFIPDDNMVIGTVVCRNIYYYFNAANKLVKVKLVVPKIHKGEMKYILVSKFEDPTNIYDLANGYQTVWNNIDEVRLVMTYFEDPIDFLTVEFMSDYDLNESKKINKSVDDF